MSDRGPPANREPGTTPQKRRRAAAPFGNTERGWDSNPRSRAHEAREDSRSSTARRLRGLAGRIRTCDLRRPKPVGWPAPLQPDEVRSVPPAGLEPAASGLRARRHRRFDHGGLKLRRQDSNLPFAINSRASCRLGRAGTSGAGTKAEGEGVEPPRPVKAHPFSRRDTAPLAVLPKMAPAGLEPAPPRVRAGRSAVLSYGAERCDRQGSNLRRPAFQAGALPG